MAFVPNPTTLKMVAVGKGRYVYPTLVTWDGPEGISLADADVREGDDGRGPLPPGRPFVLSGQRTDQTTSYAWLTINENAYETWDSAFSVRREVIVPVKVGNTVRDLRVKLTHVRIIPADFHLLWIDATHAGSNGVARIVYEVWSRLRRVIPHWIPESQANLQKQATEDGDGSPSQRRWRGGPPTEQAKAG
jgi:hypothetical protein